MPKAGVGLEHTGVDGEPLALHEAHRHRSPNHAFEDVAKDITSLKRPRRSSENVE